MPMTQNISGKISREKIWTKPKGVGSRVGGKDGWREGYGGVKMETTVLEQ